MAHWMYESNIQADHGRRESLYPPGAVCLYSNQQKIIANNQGRENKPKQQDFCLDGVYISVELDSTKGVGRRQAQNCKRSELCHLF